MNQMRLGDLGKVVVVISPHDDDGAIGCGGILGDLSRTGAQTYVLIMTDGSLGYSSAKQKLTIKETRHREAESAYRILGAAPVFLDFPDMNLKPFTSWETMNGEDGAYKRVLRILRQVRPETVLIPNPSDWHPDHKASFDIGLSISNLASIPTVADFGEPIDLRHLFCYRTWDELDKITHTYKLSRETQKTKRQALSEFKSQVSVLKEVGVKFKEELLQKLK